MRRLESGTTLDNAFATGTNRNLLVMQVPQHAVLAGVFQSGMGSMAIIVTLEIE
jgi:hypothetical protein